MNNNLMPEINSVIFLRIGHSLLHDSESELDSELNFEYIFNNHKTCSKCRQLYLLKLDTDLITFETERSAIVAQIEILSLENKKISDNIQTQKEQLSISIYNNWNSKMKKNIDYDISKYNNIFQQITRHHEDILEIDELIKQTKLNRSL